ncbi:hypothetical protein P3342_004507 [Pyrenophora teres f. teres]|nr:hypothetical protein P3342_004507 [Pyrenophora teres f. teres]
MNGLNTINLAPKILTPPVSKNKPLDTFASTLHDSRALQPALFLGGNKVLRPNTEPFACLAFESKTPRLNDIHQHLWLAGLPAAARPLHR